MNDQKKQLLERLQSATNILVTVSNNPSIDQLAACIGLTLALNKLDKHGTAVFSGDIPSTIEFLKPEETIEKNTDSLQDFIIALDKSKADKLRYKVEDTVVKIFITPYRTSLSADDLEFSQGDFNVDAVVALGVPNQSDLDMAITAHGRILHDATVMSISCSNEPGLGSINWQDTKASSLSEMITNLVKDLGKDLLDQQIATALLTGIVATTDRFRNDNTTAATMNVAADLMSAGANQQLVTSELSQSKPIPEDKSNQPADLPAGDDDEPPAKSPDGTLKIQHEAGEQLKEKARTEDSDDLPDVRDEPAADSSESPMYTEERNDKIDSAGTDGFDMDATPPESPESDSSESEDLGEPQNGPELPKPVNPDESGEDMPVETPEPAEVDDEDEPPLPEIGEVRGTADQQNPDTNTDDASADTDTPEPEITHSSSTLAQPPLGNSPITANMNPAADMPGTTTDPFSTNLSSRGPLLSHSAPQENAATSTPPAFNDALTPEVPDAPPAELPTTMPPPAEPPVFAAADSPNNAAPPAALGASAPYQPPNFNSQPAAASPPFGAPNPDSAFAAPPDSLNEPTPTPDSPLPADQPADDVDSAREEVMRALSEQGDSPVPPATPPAAPEFGSLPPSPVPSPADQPMDMPMPPAPTPSPLQPSPPMPPVSPMPTQTVQPGTLPPPVPPPMVPNWPNQPK